MKGTRTYILRCGDRVRFVHVDHLKSTLADMGAPLEELPRVDESEIRKPISRGSTIVLESPISVSTPRNVADSTGTERVKDCSVPKGGTSRTVEPNPENSITQVSQG